MKYYIKTIIYSILFGTFFFVSSGKPCDNVRECEAPPLYLKYFECFQLGNYWIFESENGDLNDSLYIESILISS